jgi:hypothetical protein
VEGRFQRCNNQHPCGSAPPVFDSRAYDEVEISPPTEAGTGKAPTAKATSKIKGPTAEPPYNVAGEGERLKLKRMPSARVKNIGFDRRVSECPPARWEFDSDGAFQVAMRNFEQKKEENGCD